MDELNEIIPADYRLTQMPAHVRAAILAYFDCDVDEAIHKAHQLVMNYHRPPAWAEYLDNFSHNLNKGVTIQ